MSNVDTILNSFFTGNPWSVTSPYVLTNDYHQTSTPQAYTIEMPLVGVTKNELNVKVQDDVLTISTSPSSKSRFVRPMKKSWYLNEDVDTNSIQAKLDNGLLTVTLPRTQTQKKNIDVLVS